jgi:hypothetical protein
LNDWQPENVDREGMPSGSAMFILMTKVPGIPITKEMMKSRTFDEREEIRKRFKKAIM